MAPPDQLVSRIAAIGGRSAGSDAERRAARLLARELRGLGRTARVQTVWVRPSWPPVLVALCALAVLGTVVSVDHPRTGLGMCAAALLLFAGELSGRLPLLRRLTVARATQNVVSIADHEAPVRLVLTAAIDVPRAGALDRGGPARWGAAARRRLGRLAPGGFGLMALGLLLATAGSALRELGVDATWVGLVQLVPAALLILAVGGALDHWTSDTGAGANADASACATALALVEVLDRRPPRMLAVDVVFAGAGHAHALGMRRWIAAQRRTGVVAEEVAVIHLDACGSGTPVWWDRDGLVLPLSYHPRLTALAAETAARQPRLGARGVQGRAATGARAARAVGWPAIAVGCRDDRDLAPHAGTEDDTAQRVDPEAMAGCLEFTLALVRALDRELLAPTGD